MAVQEAGAGVGWHQIAVETLKRNSVDLVVYVPDNVLKPLIKAIHEDSYFTAFSATREEEAVGIVAGAFMAGRRGIVLMQTSGFATLANVIAYPELLYSGQRVYNRNFQVLELLAVVSVWYLALTTFFSVIQAEIEARLRPDEQRGGWRAIMRRVIEPPANWIGHRD